jgi:hypothetical protein
MINIVVFVSPWNECIPPYSIFFTFNPSIFVDLRSVPSLILFFIGRTAAHEIIKEGG